VYGGETGVSTDSIDVLWALDVSTITPNASTLSLSPGWRYYRLTGQPSVVYPGSGQTLDWNLVANWTWASLPPIVGGTLFPGDFNTLATPSTTRLVSCGGWLADGLADDPPFMCVSFSIVDYSFDQAPPSVVAQTWLFDPAQMSSVDTIVTPRVTQGGNNAANVSVTNDINTVIFGGFKNFATTNEVNQLYQGSTIAGRAVMTDTTTQPTPTLTISSYSSVAMTQIENNMVLWCVPLPLLANVDRWAYRA